MHFYYQMQRQNLWPGQQGVKSGLSCCSTDGLLVCTGDLRRALLGLSGRQAGPQTEEGRSSTQQPSRAAPGLSPLHKPVLFPGFVFVSCFVFPYVRYTDLASDQLMFSLENSLSPLHVYCMALSSDSLSLSMASHSHPHTTALHFSCCPYKWAGSNLDLKSQSLLFTLLWLIGLCKVSSNSDLTEWGHAGWEVGFQRSVKSPLCPLLFIHLHVSVYLPLKMKGKSLLWRVCWVFSPIT